MKTKAIEVVADQINLMRHEAQEIEDLHMSPDCKFDDPDAEAKYVKLAETRNELELLVCSQGMDACEYLHSLIRR